MYFARNGCCSICDTSCSGVDNLLQGWEGGLLTKDTNITVSWIEITCDQLISNQYSRNPAPPNQEQLIGYQPNTLTSCWASTGAI